MSSPGSIATSFHCCSLMRPPQNPVLRGGSGFWRSGHAVYAGNWLPSNENSDYGELENLADSRYCHIDTLDENIHMLGPRWVFSTVFLGSGLTVTVIYLCEIFHHLTHMFQIYRVVQLTDGDHHGGCAHTARTPREPCWISGPSPGRESVENTKICLAWRREVMDCFFFFKASTFRISAH